MAADPPPAEFEISRAEPGGVSNIYACGQHLAHTIRVLWENGVTTVVAVKPADPAIHGCKGHLENWPVP